MRVRCIISGWLVFLFIFSVPLNAQNLTDAYAILDKYFDAGGGLERIKAEKTFYVEGTLSLGGMQGSIKVWNQLPGKSRAEVDLGILKIVQGDNGEFEWTVDQNGKLQKVTNLDEAAIKRRKVRRLLNEYAYADPNSDIFTVTFDSIQKIDDKDCYAVKVTNNINNDSYTLLINTETFMQEKAVYIEDVNSRDAFYGDYREIEGLLVPFYTKEVGHQTGQPQELTMTLYESNPEIDEAMFEPPGEGKRDYRFLSGTSAENIPFYFIENHLYIPVIINGRERIWILDTGAAVSVITKDFADELGLKPEGDMTGLGAGGTVQVSFTKLPKFQIANIEFDEQVAAVIDMSDLIRLLGPDVVGILGFDFLARFVTKIDYANELVSFYDPESYVYTGPGRELDIHLDQSVFETRAVLDGIHNGIWLFDIGAGSMSLNGAYAVREGYAARPGLIGQGHGAGNAFANKVVKCDSLQLAGYTIYNPRVSFHFGGTDTMFTADQIGVLGNNIFRNFIVYVDYKG